MTGSRSLRPIQTILDIEPALLPHQQALAEWLAHYYVAPLALTAFMMLPPGLMQRSQNVLQLVKSQWLAPDATQLEASPRLRALIGLLLADGELDIERLKELLGQKQAKELLREAMASGLIRREAQLSEPRVKKRRKRLVRLAANAQTLVAWRQRTEALLQQRAESMASTTSVASIAPSPHMASDRARHIRHAQTADARPLEPVWHNDR